MPHDIALISTIAAGLGFSLAGGYVAVRCGLSPIVGYLLAGIAVGPFTPGFVADVHLAEQLAEIGVILLMFSVGLHFSIRDLLAVRRIAVPGAIIQVIVASLLGAGLATYWGWPPGGAIVFGLALSVASTVVVLRAMEQRQIMASPDGHIAVGWLVVEDLVTVIVLVLLPVLALQFGPGTAGSQSSVLVALGWTLGKVVVFVAVMLLIGARILPWLFDQIAKTGSRELFTLATLATALGVAVGASELFGVSFALGAFAAGIVINASLHSKRARQEALPLQEAFGALFFVSVGMLFDPEILLQAPLQIAAILAVIILGKAVVGFATVLVFRRPLHTALIIGASLAQIGEFSFILAVLGEDMGLLPPGGQGLIVAGALISIAVNPLMFWLADRIQRATKSAAAT